MMTVLQTDYFKRLFNEFSVYFSFLGQFCKIASDFFHFISFFLLMLPMAIATESKSKHKNKIFCYVVWLGRSNNL